MRIERRCCCYRKEEKNDGAEAKPDFSSSSTTFRFGLQGKSSFLHVKGGEGRMKCEQTEKKKSEGGGILTGR